MTTNQTNPTETKEYPSLLKRVKAALIDIVAIVLFMYGMSDLFSLFEEVPDSFRISAFVFIWVLYDPIWVSLLGGTIGHRYMGIRVKKERNELKNISLPAAVFRYFLKSTLGWFSYLTMSGSQKKKALHDNAVGSVVVFD